MLLEYMLSVMSDVIIVYMLFVMSDIIKLWYLSCLTLKVVHAKNLKSELIKLFTNS